MIQAQPKKPRSVEVPYPADETVVVTFRRLGAHEKTVISGNSGGATGDVLAELHQPNVGVVKWAGVTGADGKELPYTVAALDAVCEAEPGFLGWFNGQLLDLFSGKGQQDFEGKSEPPETGSEAESPTTP